MFKNKTLLITGGTGSFGNAVMRRFINEDIKEIRIFSRDEKKQSDMRLNFPDPRIKFYIGDVRDANSLTHVMKDVDYVFHAAALKQVPSCEFFPIEAVKTNILGTNNVLDAAIAAGVKRVVCLSTDKAAYPINAMGISKAMMEKVFIAKSREAKQYGTVICGTRYGNVMASRGSVIPLFLDQISQGKELTITNPNMTRFLMSLDEAVDLVLYAFKNGEAGDLFVQKSPASTIEDLAKAILEITNSDPNNYRIIGTRHGEKVYETLLTKEEFVKAEDLPGYYKIPMDARELNYDLYFSAGVEKSSIEEYNSDNTYRLNVDEIKQKLFDLYEIKDSLGQFK